MAPRAKRRPRSAKVYALPGVERRDLHSYVPTQRLLEKAIEKGLSDVVLVGIDRTGQLYVAGSFQDCDKATGVLMRGVSLISSGTVGLVAGEVHDTANDE